MRNIYAFALFMFPTTAFCMHIKPSTIKTLTHNRNYILTSKSFDVQQSRRDAYQKYCPTKINWDQPPLKTYTTELKPNTAEKNNSEYWKWAVKK